MLTPLSGIMTPLGRPTRIIPSGPAFTPPDVAGLAAWLKADSLALSNGDPVATWTDSSGNSRNAAQATSGLRPTFEASSVNGLPSVRFTGGHYLEFGSPWEGLWSAVEVFVVFKLDADPPASGTGGGGFWGPSRVFDCNIPYEDGTIYEGFGSTALKTTGNPTLSLASWRTYNVTSASGEWTSRIDGTVHYTTATNAVGFVETRGTYLGASHNAGSYWMTGRIAEFVLYDHALTTTDRASVQGYLDSRYGL